MTTTSIDDHTSRLLPVSGENFTLVDADVYEAVKHLRWHIVGLGYVASFQRDDRGVRHTVYLHRHIMAAPKGLQVDHINWSTLDNRRSNLRLVTGSENCQNSLRGGHARSGVRGVYWHHAGKKWHARIGLNRRIHSLGLYDTVEEAAAVVAEARRRLHPYAPLPAEGTRA